MLKSLLNTFATPRENQHRPNAAGQLALAALLVRVARSDGHYASVEMAGIEKALTGYFGLTEAEAVTLRREGEALEERASDTVQFTRALKDLVPESQRLGLLETIWMVALADGAREDHEDALIRLVTRLLGVTDRDSALVRQRIARK
ncbi:MAG: TerB family tellurite resistance protein [Paracoccaceae bacterium]